MKKLLLLIIAISLAVQCRGQGKVNTITLNLADTTFTIPEAVHKLKKGDFYKLKITPINMNLYKVVIDKKDTLLTTGISFPAFEMVSLGSVGELLGNINVSAISAIAGKDMVKVLNNDYIINLADSMGVKANSPDLKKIIEARISEVKTQLLKKENLERIFRDSIDNLQLIVQKKILSYSVLDASHPSFKLLSGKISFDYVIRQTEIIRTGLRSLSRSVENLQSDYLQYTQNDNVSKTINDDRNKDLKDADKLLREALARVISNADKLNESISSEKVTEWIRELVCKENNSSTSYTSLPMQLNGDRTTLQIQIIPVKPESGLPLYETMIQFPEAKEFYVGIGSSFYYAFTFKDEVYSIQSVVVNDTTTNYNIVNENSRKGETGLATLIHFGWRPWYDSKPGWLCLNMVAGPALSLTKPVRPRIAIGGGIAVGQGNMFSLNFLYMGGYISQKSEVYDPNETYSLRPENITVSRLRFSGAITVGYIYKF